MELVQLAASVWIFPEYQQRKALRPPDNEPACISKLILHSEYSRIELNSNAYSPAQILFMFIDVPIMLPLLAYFSSATIQRLGYLLEVIEETEQADNLYSLFKQTGKTMRRTPLKQSVSTNEDMVIDNRWKIIVNYEIDTDEI